MTGLAGVATLVAWWLAAGPVRGGDTVTVPELLARRGESRVELVGATLDWERRLWRVESSEGARFFARDPRHVPVVDAGALEHSAEHLADTRVRLVVAAFAPRWVFFDRTVPGSGRHGRGWPPALFAARVGERGWELADVAALTSLPRPGAPGMRPRLEVRLVGADRSQAMPTRMLTSPAAGAVWIVSEKVPSVTDATAREFLDRREHVGLLTRDPSAWMPADGPLDRLWAHVTGAARAADGWALVTVPGVREHTVQVWAPITDTRDRLWVALRDDRPPPSGPLPGVYRRFRRVGEFVEMTQSLRTRRAEGVLLVESAAR